MALSGALFSSVSGLDVMSTAISVVGDNLANVNTPGFKARRPEFADVLGQTISTVGGFSQIGAGAKIARVSQIFTQGTFETTNRPTDVAIEGRGFFIVDGPQGRFYTRAGIFHFDADGYLVNPAGQRVQGFGIDPTTGLPNGQLQDIQITNSVAAPRATTLVNMSLNLDSGTPVSAGFDPANPNANNPHRTVITVYDSLGNAHSVTFYFLKTQQNAGPPPSSVWEWTATVPTAETTDAPANPSDTVVVQGQGTLTFDANGLLQSTSVTTPLVFNFAGGANPGQAVTVDFGPLVGSASSGDLTTQYGAPSSTNSFRQDGFGAGTLQILNIDRDGFLTGQFSNGATINLGQLALASFPNIEGLRSVGNNNFIESRESGQPLIGAPQAGGFGSIRSSSLEQSNVDLAAEFVRLIINQRAFQANTRTVATTNELLANLVSLGQ